MSYRRLLEIDDERVVISRNLGRIPAHIAVHERWLQALRSDRERLEIRRRRAESDYYSALQQDRARAVLEPQYVGGPTVPGTVDLRDPDHPRIPYPARAPHQRKEQLQGELQEVDRAIGERETARRGWQTQIGDAERRLAELDAEQTRLEAELEAERLAWQREDEERTRAADHRGLRDRLAAAVGLT